MHPGYQGNGGRQTPCLWPLRHRPCFSPVSLCRAELPKGDTAPSLPLATPLTSSSSPTLWIRQTSGAKARTQTEPMPQVDGRHLSLRSHLELVD